MNNKTPSAVITASTSNRSRQMQPRDWAQQASYVCPDYKSSILRGPTQAFIQLAEMCGKNGRSIAGELLGDLTDRFTTNELDSDLTRNSRHSSEPLGERIVVSGQLLDDLGKPVTGALIEIWQANSAGRYVHKADQHDAPVDPNFSGAGRLITDRDGRYRFYSIRPGAYPWGNHANAWRPSHIHFSVMGENIATRLVTQMYFPGDPLLDLDPIFKAVPKQARERLISHLDLSITEPDFALGYHFDIVVRGSRATPHSTGK